MLTQRARHAALQVSHLKVFARALQTMLLSALWGEARGKVWVGGEAGALDRDIGEAVVSP
jgi:hypothetical protein